MFCVLSIPGDASKLDVLLLTYEHSNFYFLLLYLQYVNNHTRFPGTCRQPVNLITSLCVNITHSTVYSRIKLAQLLAQNNKKIACQQNEAGKIFSPLLNAEIIQIGMAKCANSNNLSCFSFAQQ